MHSYAPRVRALAAAVGLDILAVGCISGAVTCLSDFLVLCRRMIPSLVAIQLLSVLYFVDTTRGYLRENYVSTRGDRGVQQN
jgi:hypothetical protein